MKIIWLLGTRYIFNNEPVVHKMTVIPGRHSLDLIELGGRVGDYLREVKDEDEPLSQ